MSETNDEQAGLPERRERLPEPSTDDAEATEQVTQWSAWWAAPLPPPAQLAQYDNVLPGLAERIVSLTENEVAHRHWLDRAFVRYRFFGQWASVIIALAAIGAGAYLVSTGQNGYGFAAIISAVVALVAVFLVRQFFGNGQNGRSSPTA